MATTAHISEFLLDLPTLRNNAQGGTLVFNTFATYGIAPAGNPLLGHSPRWGGGLELVG